MRAKKKKGPNLGTAFEEIEKNIEQSLEPVDLKSKIREFEAQRSTRREMITGLAVVYDLKEKPLSKAEFKNLGMDGVCCEILPVEIKQQEEVYVQFDNSLNLGPVLCTVQWISNIEGHRTNNKLIGLRFKKMTAIKQKHLQEFLEKIYKGRKKDPFYVG